MKTLINLCLLAILILIWSCSKEDSTQSEFDKSPKASYNASEAPGQLLEEVLIRPAKVRNASTEEKQQCARMSPYVEIQDNHFIISITQSEAIALGVSEATYSALVKSVEIVNHTTDSLVQAQANCDKITSGIEKSLTIVPLSSNRLKSNGTETYNTTNTGQGAGTFSFKGTGKIRVTVAVLTLGPWHFNMTETFWKTDKDLPMMTQTKTGFGSKTFSFEWTSPLEYPTGTPWHMSFSASGGLIAGPLGSDLDVRITVQSAN